MDSNIDKVAFCVNALPGSHQARSDFVRKLLFRNYQHLISFHGRSSLAPVTRPHHLLLRATSSESSASSVSSASSSLSSVSRRSFLHHGSLVLLSAATMVLFELLAPASASIARADAFSDERAEKVKKIVGPAGQMELFAIPDDPPQISLVDFVKQVEENHVEGVIFKGAQYEKAYPKIQGQVYAISEGYPKEKAQSPESPLKVVAYLRDRKVPWRLVVDLNIKPKKKD